MDEIRKEIDKIDDKIIPLLEKRHKLIKEIAKKKKPLTDKNREEFILNKCPSIYSRSIFKKIFQLSKKIISSL